MIRLALPLSVAALAVVACSPPPRPRHIPGPPTTCGAERVAHYVGRKATNRVTNAIARRSGAKSIRWIRPGMAVTMDFREDRLNVDLAEKGVIKGFRCG